MRDIIGKGEVRADSTGLMRLLQKQQALERNICDEKRQMIRKIFCAVYKIKEEQRKYSTLCKEAG